jgi:hypothetical protein
MKRSRMMLFFASPLPAATLQEWYLPDVVEALFLLP